MYMTKYKGNIYWKMFFMKLIQYGTLKETQIYDFIILNTKIYSVV